MDVYLLIIYRVSASLWAPAFGSGVVLAAALREVDCAPYAQARAWSLYNGLQGCERGADKRHAICLLFLLELKFEYVILAYPIEIGFDVERCL